MRQALERRQAVLSEHVRMEFGCQRAKHDGSEHDPGSHLADDGRLADVAQLRRQ
jgi:hypothetical protein